MVNHLIEVDLVQTGSNQSQQETEMNNDYSVSTTKKDQLAYSEEERISEAYPASKRKKRKLNIITIAICALVPIVILISIPVSCINETQ